MAASSNLNLNLCRWFIYFFSKLETILRQTTCILLVFSFDVKLNRLAIEIGILLHTNKINTLNIKITILELLDLVIFNCYC